MQIIDGKKISEEIKDEVKEEVAQLKAEGKDIALAVIQVGADPASSVYVRNKKRACEYVGIESVSYELPEETTQEELMAIVDKCNKDPKINGILVQLPLPKHLDEDEVLLAIDPKKDVDGFHPVSVGNMVIGEKGFLPCTPAGVIQLLKRSGVEIDGKECVVVGRSNIVGKPMAMLLLRENGTVTVCHSHTKDLKEVCKRADILVVAIGKPKFINDSYVKDGAVVIDVGIHRNENNKLCGDVDYDKVAPKTSAITPVPGGVGPMTIAMLKTAPKSDIIVLIVTFILTVVFDLVVAIEIGMVIACLLFIKRMSEETHVDSWVYVDDDTPEIDDHLARLPLAIRVYEITGPLFFGASDAIEHIVVKDFTKCLILRMRSVPALDSTALNALKDLVDTCEKKGITIVFSHVNEQPMKVMKKAGFIELVGKEHFCPNIAVALKHAEDCID
mgnify:CR=1 FL=1